MNHKEEKNGENRQGNAQKTPIIRRLAVLVLLVGVLTYIGVYVYQALYNPLKTSSAIAYTAMESDTVDGFVVRDEEAVTADYAYVSVSVSEGTKVGKNQNMAVAYNSQNDYELGYELESLQDQLNQLEYSLDYESTTTSAATLDDTIYSGLTSLSAMISAGDISGLPDVSTTLKSALLRRDYVSSGISGLEDKVTQVNAQIAAIKSRLSDNAVQVSAPYSGIYSSYIDGMERVLTPYKVMQMTTTELLGCAAAAYDAEAGAVGKIVSGTKWYFAFVANRTQAETLSKRSSVKLRFDSEDDPYTMTVEQVGVADNAGDCVVLLSCDKGFGSMLQRRECSAEIITGSSTGLRVPKEALHLEEDGTTGVYCISGVQATFKKVDILWIMDEYYIVDKDANSPYSLKEGEDVIVSAKDLYEGKIIR